MQMEERGTIRGWERAHCFERRILMAGVETGAARCGVVRKFQMEPGADWRAWRRGRWGRRGGYRFGWFDCRRRNGGAGSHVHVS